MNISRDHGAGEPPSEPTRSRSRDARLVVSGILAALGVWFAVANTTEIRVHFWLVSTRTPVVVALVVAAALGVGIGLLAGRRFRRPSP